MWAQGGAGGIVHAEGALIHAVSQQMVKHDCCISPASDTLEYPVASANLELCGEENWGSLILNQLPQHKATAGLLFDFHL